jgi:hypothetical protein
MSFTSSIAGGLLSWSSTLLKRIPAMFGRWRATSKTTLFLPARKPKKVEHSSPELACENLGSSFQRCSTNSETNRTSLHWLARPHLSNRLTRPRCIQEQTWTVWI